MNDIQNSTQNRLPAPNAGTLMEYTPLGNRLPIKLSVEIVMRDLCKPTKKGHLCTPAQAMRFLMLCRARELDPWAGDAFLVGFDTDDGPDFQLFTAHQAFAKRAEVNPTYDGMQSGVIIAKENSEIEERETDFLFKSEVLLGGWAKVYVKGRRFPTYRRLNFDTMTKKKALWLTMPAGMIVKCAEADALRSTFPTTLGGLYLQEEIQPTLVEDAAPSSPPTGTFQIGKPATNGKSDTKIEAKKEEAKPAPKQETKTEPPKETQRKVRKPTADAIRAECGRRGEFPAIHLSRFKVESVDDLTQAQGDELLTELRKPVDNQDADVANELQDTSV